MTSSKDWNPLTWKQNSEVWIGIKFTKPSRSTAPVWCQMCVNDLFNSVPLLFILNQMAFHVSTKSYLAWCWHWKQNIIFFKIFCLFWLASIPWLTLHHQPTNLPNTAIYHWFNYRHFISQQRKEDNNFSRWLYIY